MESLCVRARVRPGWPRVSRWPCAHGNQTVGATSRLGHTVVSATFSVGPLLQTMPQCRDSRETIIMRTDAVIPCCHLGKVTGFSGCRPSCQWPYRRARPVAACPCLGPAWFRHHVGGGVQSVSRWRGCAGGGGPGLVDAVASLPGDRRPLLTRAAQATLIHQKLTPQDNDWVESLPHLEMTQ